MKSSSSLLIAISLASTAAWAQTGVPATRVVPAQSAPAQSAEPNSGPQNMREPTTDAQNRPALQGGEQSSGGSDQSSNASRSSAGAAQGSASTDQSSGAPGGASGLGIGSQLITQDIVNAKVPIPSPVTAQPQTENGVTFICGGVGDAEAQFMKQSAKDYDLKLTFAARSGAYVSNPTVTIADAKGNEVLSKICGGPMMLVDLPKSGTYRVKAEVAGHSLDRTVKVREGRMNAAVFTWPSNVVGVDRQAETRRGSSTQSSGGNMTGSGEGSGTSSDQAPVRRGSDSPDRQKAD